jgi:hypothetical protein
VEERGCFFVEIGQSFLCSPIIREIITKAIVVLTALAVFPILGLGPDTNSLPSTGGSERSRQGFREPTRRFLAIVPFAVMRLIVALFASRSFSAGKLEGEGR